MCSQLHASFFARQERPWGDVMQAILFRTVVTRLRDLVQRKDHAKFWRASVLLLLQVAFVLFVLT